MAKTTAQDFQRHIGRYQDMALREPVEITRHGRSHLVLLSSEEFRRLKRRDRRASAAQELPAEILEAVARSEMAPNPSFDSRELARRKQRERVRDERALAARRGGAVDVNSRNGLFGPVDWSKVIVRGLAGRSRG